MNTTTVRRSATLNLTAEQRLARCATPMTKHQLYSALTGNGRISINGIPVILSSIQREDGSGRSFNLLVYHEGKAYKCYCRTQD
ncbi:hypothetical protein [Nitrospira sp. BLG_2]|uniref:hypothetical protein n=1 Tax=Nitrospira sp. BLG_2 TaxID=3397507 RepID=UPI003B995BD2